MSDKNTPLANVHEIASAIFLIADPEIQDSECDFNKATVARRTTTNKENDKIINSLIVELEKTLKQIKTASEKQQAQVKFIQAMQSAIDTKKYFSNPKRSPKIPTFWDKGTGFHFDGPLTIVDCAWTNTPARFTQFVSKHSKLCAGVSHDANPSDVAFAVMDKNGKIIIIGNSLKATFSKNPVCIYNGGFSAFMKIICDREDLANKDALVASASAVTAAGAVTEPYDQFIVDTTLHFSQGNVKWSGTKDERKKIWKAEKTPSLEKSKLIALSIVRDKLLDYFVKSTKITQKSTGIFEGPISQDDASKIIGGIFQFTHAAISTGACNVPYLKVTSKLNKKLNPNTGIADCGTVINVPLITDYVINGQNSLTLEEVGSVSFKLSLNGKPCFLIRAKLESVPPSALKIAIVPYKEESKKRKSTASNQQKTKKSAVASTPPATNVPVNQPMPEYTKDDLNGMKIEELKKIITNLNQPFPKPQPRKKTDWINFVSKLLNIPTSSSGGAKPIKSNLYTLSTNSPILDDIIINYNLSLEESSLLIKIWEENFLTDEEENDPFMKKYDETKLKNSDIKIILLRGIQNELNILYNQDPTLYTRIINQTNNIYTRAYKILMDNILPLQILEQKLSDKAQKSKTKKRKNKRKTKKKKKNKNKK